MFCALSFREMPLRTRRLNVVKVFSELQLFAILQVCMVLRVEENGLVGEWIQRNGYGLAQLVATTAILPATLFVVWKRVQDLREAEPQDGVDETANPLGSK